MRLQASSFTRLGLTVLGVWFLAACDKAPQGPSFNVSQKSGATSTSSNSTADGSLSLSSCTAPTKTNYRLTRSEIANNLATVLNLTTTEAAAFKGSLSVDTSKTGYENDSTSLTFTGDQVYSLALALDSVLTADKINNVLNCSGKTDVNDSCVNAALLSLAQKAYSLSSDTDPAIVSYKALLASLKTKDAERLSFAVKAIFMSPNFLYGSTDKESLRSHIANTVWNESSAYTSNADLQKLDDKAFIDALMKDQKAYRFAESFLMRHLKLDDITKNIDQSAAADRYALLQSMSQETRLFIADIFKNDRPINELITSKSTFMNSDIAKIYGVNGPGADFVKVDLPKNRQGLLTQPSVLTVTSKPTETNIISRGLWIVEKVLCQQIPAPPSVQALPGDTGSQPKTQREQLEAHRANPACAACHNLMDPPGFALENFGPTGAFRDHYDNNLPIDAEATFADKTVTSTPDEFFAYIDKNQAAFSKCMARELLVYVMRRNLTDADQCAVDTLAKGMGEKSWGMETSLNEILSWYQK